MNITDIRNHFAFMFKNQKFTMDRTGACTIELLGASFLANENAIFGTPNNDYIEKEIAWYKSMSTNVNDIYGEERACPAAWKYAANKYGEINSNYGKLIYSELYYNQFGKVIGELINNPDTRRASMIYTRPSIWEEATDNGKNDFICTNSVTYYIRDNVLSAVVQMRSNDVVFGYRNDFSWQSYVLEELCNVLKFTKCGKDLTTGSIYWQVQNLHIYSRHFYLVDHFIKTGETYISKVDYDELYS